jgi:hypothetical protein
MANLSNAPLATRLVARLPDTPANFTPMSNSQANNPTTIYNTLFAGKMKMNVPTIPLMVGGWVRRNANPPPSVSNIDQKRLSLLLNSALGQTAQGKAPSPKLVQHLAALFPQFFPQAVNPAIGGANIATSGSLRGLLGLDADRTDAPGLVSNLLAVAQTQEGANRLNQVFALPVLKNGEMLASRAGPNDLRNVDIARLQAELRELMQNGQGGTQRAQQLATINYQYALLRHAGARGEVSLQLNPLALAFGGPGLAQTVLGNLFSTALSFSDSRERRANMQIARGKLEQSILQALKSGDDETRVIKQTLATISGDQPGSTRAGWTSANNELFNSAKRLAAIRHSVNETRVLAPYVKHPSYGMNLYEAHRDTVRKMEALANYGHIAYLPKRIELMARVGGLLDPRTNRVDPTANLLDGLFSPGQANRATRRMTFPALL